MDVPEQLAQDADALKQSTGYDVELIPVDSRIYVLVRAASLPAGVYSRPTSDVLLITDFQYPMSAMDMFYMESDIQLGNGTVPSHANTLEPHANRTWRRWSWHRHGKWTLGSDNLLSHWVFVEQAWAQEAQR